MGEEQFQLKNDTSTMFTFFFPKLQLKWKYPDRHSAWGLEKHVSFGHFHYRISPKNEIQKIGVGGEIQKKDLFVDEILCANPSK